MQVLSIDDFAFKDGTYLNRLYFNPEMTEMTALENLPDPLSSLRQLQDPRPLINITRHTKASNSRLDCYSLRRRERERQRRRRRRRAKSKSHAALAAVHIGLAPVRSRVPLADHRITAAFRLSRTVSTTRHVDRATGTRVVKESTRLARTIRFSSSATVFQRFLVLSGGKKAWYQRTTHTPLCSHAHTSFTVK